jgi:hypothetical protein
MSTILFGQFFGPVGIRTRGNLNQLQGPNESFESLLLVLIKQPGENVIRKQLLCRCIFDQTKTTDSMHAFAKKRLRDRKLVCSDRFSRKLP